MEVIRRPCTLFILIVLTGFVEMLKILQDPVEPFGFTENKFRFCWGCKSITYVCRKTDLDVDLHLDPHLNPEHKYHMIRNNPDNVTKEDKVGQEAEIDGRPCRLYIDTVQHEYKRCRISYGFVEITGEAYLDIKDALDDIMLKWKRRFPKKD